MCREPGRLAWSFAVRELGRDVMCQIWLRFELSKLLQQQLRGTRDALAVCDLAELQELERPRGRGLP